MIRNIFKELIGKSLKPPSNGKKTSFLIERRLSTLASNTRRVGKEFNKVKLIGTVGGKKLYYEHQINFWLTTQHHYRPKNKESFTVKNWHQIVVTSPHARELLKGKIESGYRMHLSGKISYSPFITEDGKECQKAVIIANEVFLCKANNCSDNVNRVKTIPIDLNETRLMGRIVGDLHQQSNSALFSLVTHFNTRNENGEEIQNQSIHSILIIDRDLQQRAAGIIKQGKRVIVYGQIDYRKQLDRSGSKCYSAIVVANRILSVEEISLFES